MKPDKNQINVTEIKYLAKPGIISVIVLAAAIGIIYVGFNQVKNINDQYSQDKKDQTILTQNLNTLRRVDEELRTEQDFIEVALPVKNASIYFISQIKSVAEEMGLIVTDVRTGSVNDDNKALSKSGVSFEVEGPNDVITYFIDALTKTLPIGNINKIKSVLTGTNMRTSVTIDVYSATLPETLPSLKAAVTGLTDQEKEILLDLTTYRLPQFIAPTASEPTNRENPFE